MSVNYAAWRTMHVRPQVITLKPHFVPQLYRPASSRTATSVDWFTVLVSVQVCQEIQVTVSDLTVTINGKCSL